MAAAAVMRRFDYCFSGTPSYPAILEGRVELEAGTEGQVEGPGGAICFLTLAQDHGSLASLGFRIGTFAYCNDVVRLPEETLARLEGLDTLVVDALRYAPHPTHANLDQALAWIDRLRPRRAVLTNLHVDLDYARLCRELPGHVRPAHDGMELDFG
jgi:phosphoribosyl 1,2-cyclic phosphate phosphodiesterase